MRPHSRNLCRDALLTNFELELRRIFSTSALERDVIIRIMKNIDAHRGPIVAMTINHRLMYTGSADGTAKAGPSIHDVRTGLSCLL